MGAGYEDYCHFAAGTPNTCAFTEIPQAVIDACEAVPAQTGAPGDSSGLTLSEADCDAATAADHGCAATGCVWDTQRSAPWNVTRGPLWERRKQRS